MEYRLCRRPRFPHLQIQGGCRVTGYATCWGYAASPKVSLTASSAAKASAEVHPADNHGAQGFERL